MDATTSARHDIDRLRRQCRYEEAEQAVAAVLEAEGERLDLLILRGRIDLDRERPTDALLHFDRAAELAPDDDAPRAWRIAALHQAHKCDEACEVAERELAVFPDSIVIRVALARTLIWVGRPDRALTHLDDALAVDDGDVNALAWRVVALYQQYRHDEAEVAATEALERHPDNPDLRVSLARVHVCRRWYREAIGELNQALQIDSGHLDALCDRIYCLWNLYEYESAESAALVALERFPGAAWLRIAAAGVYVDQQRHDEALKLLDEVVAASSPPSLLDWKATVLRWSGLHHDAEQLLRTTLASHPEAPEIHVGLARLLEDRNRLGEALEAAETAVLLSPYLGSALNVRIRLLSLLSRPDAAQDAANDAVRIRPYATAHRRRLGDILFDQRRYAEALEEFRKVVRWTRTTRTHGRRVLVSFGC